MSVTLNLNQSQGQVYLRTIGGCDRVDTIRINRSLASPLVVVSSVGTCIAASTSPSFYINAAGANIGNLPITWTFAPVTGWSITGSQNGPTIVAAAAASAVSTTVTANVTGCPAPLNLAVYIKPGVPGNPTGTQCFTQSVGGAQPYNATAATSAVNYTWTYPAGWTTASPQITATPTVNVTTNGTAIGNVCITANSALATCNTPAAACLATAFIPAAPDSILQVSPVCIRVGNTKAVNARAANSAVSLKVFTPVPGTTYTWTIPAAMVDPAIPITYGNSGTSINSSVSFTCNGRPGVYTISVSASGICSGSATRSRVFTLSIRTDTLFSSTFAGVNLAVGILPAVTQDPAITAYQWFKWNVSTLTASNIAATSYSILLNNAATKGIYGVEGTYADGCKAIFLHDSTNVGFKMIPGKTKPVVMNTSDIVLQPNPARSSCSLILPDGKTNVSVSIVDSKGTLLWKRSAVNSTQTTINTANWPAGEYTVILHSTGGKTTSKKLVVSK